MSRTAIGIVIVIGTVLMLVAPRAAFAEAWRVVVVRSGPDDPCIEAEALEERILTHPLLPKRDALADGVVTDSTIELRIRRGGGGVIVVDLRGGPALETTLTVRPPSCEETRERIALRVTETVRNETIRRANALAEGRQPPSRSTASKPAVRRSGLVLSLSLGAAVLDSDLFHAADEVGAPSIHAAAGMMVTPSLALLAQGGVTLADHDQYEMVEYFVGAAARWFPFWQVWIEGGLGAGWFTAGYAGTDDPFVDVGPSPALVGSVGLDILNGRPVSLGLSFNAGWTAHEDAPVTTVGFAFTLIAY